MWKKSITLFLLMYGIPAREAILLHMAMFSLSLGSVGAPLGKI